MELELVVTPGLGDNSYLIGSAGEAALVDPQRDIGRLMALAGGRHLQIRHVLETHVHNDYVSGALEVRAATGAEVVAPAKGNYEFPYRGVAEGDEVRVGDVRLVAMETPGHTPEHVAYLVYEQTDVPVAVFTGGSLMVGGAGRSDLLGVERADELTRAQYRTLRRLASLPDPTQVLPTHGAGSFCGTGPAPEERISTMLEERSRNRSLAVPDEESFVRQHLSGLPAYPRYYGAMAPINRAGPALLANVPSAGPLSPQEFDQRMQAGAWAIDGRDRESFARGHVPRSLNVELDAAFASYVGWLVPFDDPLVLVLPPPEHRSMEEATGQLRRIGYERLQGYLEGGIDAWRSGGREVGSYPLASIEDLCQAYRRGEAHRILDVRQRTEWEEGHIPDSVHVFVGDLPSHLDEVPPGGDVYAVCRTGHRSAMAASLLDREGIPVRLVNSGGVPDWIRLCAPQEPIAAREP